jgi:hypothetical protein
MKQEQRGGQQSSQEQSIPDEQASQSSLDELNRDGGEETGASGRGDVTGEDTASG